MSMARPNFATAKMDNEEQIRLALRVNQAQYQAFRGRVIPAMHRAGLYTQRFRGDEHRETVEAILYTIACQEPVLAADAASSSSWNALMALLAHIFHSENSLSSFVQQQGQFIAGQAPMPIGSSYVVPRVPPTSGGTQTSFQQAPQAQQQGSAVGRALRSSTPRGRGNTSSATSFQPLRSNAPQLPSLPPLPAFPTPPNRTSQGGDAIGSSYLVPWVPHELRPQHQATQQQYRNSQCGRHLVQTPVRQGPQTAGLTATANSTWRQPHDEPLLPYMLPSNDPRRVPLTRAITDRGRVANPTPRSSQGTSFFPRTQAQARPPTPSKAPTPLKEAKGRSAATSTPINEQILATAYKIRVTPLYPVYYVFDPLHPEMKSFGSWTISVRDILTGTPLLPSWEKLCGILNANEDCAPQSHKYVGVLETSNMTVENETGFLRWIELAMDEEGLVLGMKFSRK